MKQKLLISFLAILILALTTRAQALQFEFVAAGEPSLNLPHDLVLSPDLRLLYVADNGNDRIAVLDPDSLEVLGTFGAAELSAPHDVAFDHKGRLLVADTGNDRVVVFRLNGARGENVGVIKGSFRRPEGVAVVPGGRVYVSGAYSDNLVAIENGVEAAAIKGLSSPHDVEIDPAGHVLVVDSNNDRLLILTPGLQTVKILAGPPYNFNGPRYAFYDAVGRLWIADKYAHMVKVLGSDYELLGVIGTGKAGKHPGQLDRPEGVDVRGRDVWISDTYNNRIVRYRIAD